MKHIIDNINRMAGKYTPHQVFADWVEMSALSIAQSIEPVEEREEAFFSIARKYSEDDFFTLGCMLGRLSFLLENGLDDYLGKIYMELSTGNSHTGQFFTPFHVCEMMAGVNAEVVQGNSLEGKHNVVLHTPMYLMRGGLSVKGRNNQ